MEVGARDNGAAGVGGCGYARQGRLLLERWVMCTSARKKGRKRLCLPWPYGVRLCDDDLCIYGLWIHGS